MKRAISGAAMISAGAPLLLLITCTYIENPKIRYASMQEAHQRGAVEAGWVPSIIPTQAVELVEQHNIDTNITFVAFTLADRSALINGEPCAPIEYTSVKWFSSYPLWWPRNLRGSNEVSTRLAYYYCGSGIIGTEYEGRHYMWFAATAEETIAL